MCQFICQFFPVIDLGKQIGCLQKKIKYSKVLNMSLCASLCASFYVPAPCKIHLRRFGLRLKSKNLLAALFRAAFTPNVHDHRKAAQKTPAPHPKTPLYIDRGELRVVCPPQAAQPSRAAYFGGGLAAEIHSPSPSPPGFPLW